MGSWGKYLKKDGNEKYPVGRADVVNLLSEAEVIFIGYRTQAPVQDLPLKRAA